MKFLKHFESDRQFRDVDLQKLWDDFNKYIKELYPEIDFTKEDQFRTSINMRSNTFCIKILNPLLINKEVGFYKTANRFDDEVTFGYEGRIKHISNDTYTNQLSIIVDLERGLGTLQNVILAKIILNMRNITPKPYPNIVRIYNSWTTEIENKIKFLNDTEKYNL